MYHSKSIFVADVKTNKEKVSRGGGGKSWLVICGAGLIGSSFVRVTPQFNPISIYAVDVSENELTELT